MPAWLLLAAACAPPADPPVVEEVAADLPIPPLETVTPTAAWTPEEAVAAVTGALEGEFPSPFLVRESLAGWFRHGDAGCPGEGTMMAGPSFEGCTSEEGWYYLGVGGYVEYAGVHEDAGPWTEVELMGDMTMLAPDGRSLDVGGHWIITLHELGPAWHALVNGVWLEPGNPADWFATGISAWLDYAGSVWEGGHFLTLDGAMAIRGAVLGFEAVTLGTEGCAETPTGAITVRDPSGGTWSIDFGEACAPCGSVSFEGEPVETEACLALDGLAERIILASTPTGAAQ
ncbi:MAG: hypothetical protein ACK4YP_09905 [Myxococcota bacterium]